MSASEICSLTVIYNALWCIGKIKIDRCPPPIILVNSGIWDVDGEGLVLEMWICMANDDIEATSENDE